MIHRQLILAFAVSVSAHAQGTRLLRHPSVNGTTVAFAYAGDLWLVGTTGGTARRITSTPDVEADPQLSSNGSMVAFSRTQNGNTDVYVVSAAGGEPRRLTYHPGLDRVRGWAPDGKRIVFASDRASSPQAAYFKLWTVSAEGGFEESLPLPRAFAGTFSPDRRRVAYEEISTTFIPAWHEVSQWRHYRGGRTQPIRIIDLASNAVEKLPWRNSNDRNAMWIGNAIYFLSDRNGTTNLFSCDLSTKVVTQVTHHEDFDVMNAASDGTAVVYEQAGFIHLFDVKSAKARQLSIDVVSDFPWAQPQFKRVASLIRRAVLSPTGVRAAFEARGDIFTIPTDKGESRNLTQTSGAHEHSPTWSPDGSQLAWLSDASGEWQLMLGDQSGLTKTRMHALPGGGMAYFSSLQWSPGGKHLILQDNHLNLWMLDAVSGRTVKVDVDPYLTPARQFDAVWSPDSKWIAFTKNLENRMRAIFVYSVADAKSFQLTDALVDAVSPAFDASGKYLYFLASTNYGARTSWLEMSSVDRPVHRAMYLAVLAADEPSPLLPESGDEPVIPVTVRARGDSGMRIDATGISQRILSLSIPAGDFSNLTAGLSGSFFYTEPMGGSTPGAGLRLQRYQLKEGTSSTFLDGIRSFSVSSDRKKLLYEAAGPGGSRWGVVATEKPAKTGDGAINVAQLESWIEPHVEWAQIFRESWRIQREFFYDSHMHGADWNAVLAKYGAFLPFVNHRADLGYVIAQTGGELSAGHSYLSGRGDEPTGQPVTVGLLGADYVIENGRYRFRRIFTGENWNPELRAPLSAPGIRIDAGDYLLEVNGRPLNASTNIYSMFEQKAGRQTVLRVNNTPSVEGSRLVTVVPVGSEEGLRTRAWIEDNRRKVDQLSGGRLAYVWLPNTSTLGYTAFTRYFFTQQNKEGAIIDVRYNQGGMVADYIVNELDRKQMGYFAMRDGKPWTSPIAGIYGPKVMIINESAGSGGDALPYMFKQRRIGPVVGTRTWGGLIGTTGTPPTIDGGGITAPSLAFFDSKGEWSVENEGVSPDIEVEFLAADVIKGHDPQLERAVKEALRLLDGSPAKRVVRPAPANRSRP